MSAFRSLAAVAAVLGLAVHPLHGAAGKDGFRFLNVPASPRTASMAGAVTAAADDAASSAWNPAALADLRRSEAGLFHTALSEGMTSSALVYGRPLRTGGAALHLQTFDYGGLDAYDRFGASAGTVKASDLAAGAAYGRPIGPAWRAGVGLKSVQQTIAEASLRTWAADAGVLFSPSGGSWPSRLRWGAALRNMGGGASSGGAKTNLPQAMDLGVAYQNFSEALLVAADYSRPRDGKSRLRLGQEFWIHPSFALRAGYAGSGNAVASGWSAGFGARFRDVRLDYSFSAAKEGFDAQHRMGLVFRFGGPQEALYQEAVALIQGGAYAEAILKLKKILDIDPKHRRAISRMKEAVSLLRKERGEDAP